MRTGVTPPLNHQNVRSKSDKIKNQQQIIAMLKLLSLTNVRRNFDQLVLLG
jgi:hypothetical protein